MSPQRRSLRVAGGIGGMKPSLTPPLCLAQTGLGIIQRGYHGFRTFKAAGKGDGILLGDEGERSEAGLLDVHGTHHRLRQGEYTRLMCSRCGRRLV